MCEGHVHDREPQAVPIESLMRWLKPSHREQPKAPGWYVDAEGEYDLEVGQDRVTIYPYCSLCGLP